MMGLKRCCFNCQFRCFRCHSSCKAYALEKARDKERLERQRMETDINGFVIENIRRFKDYGGHRK